MTQYIYCIALFGCFLLADPGEIRLSSRDLELLLAGANLENLDLLDPNLAAQIQTLTQLQQTTPQGRAQIESKQSLHTG